MDDGKEREAAKASVYVWMRWLCPAEREGREAPF